MDCFKVDRVSYVEDFSMVIIADDELHTERCARIKSTYF